MLKPFVYSDANVILYACFIRQINKQLVISTTHFFSNEKQAFLKAAHYYGWLKITKT